MPVNPVPGVIFRPLNRPVKGASITHIYLLYVTYMLLNIKKLLDKLPSAMAYLECSRRELNGDH